jgi:ActR/RegA family two-component response regulator
VNRVLIIDQDAEAAQRLALGCFDKGIAVVIAETVCEAVRSLATTPVALIVAAVDRFRLGVAEQAAVFDRVAPGVPVMVTVTPTVALERRAALELGGFRVMPDPVEPDDVLKALDR